MAKKKINIDDIIVQELTKQERPVNWLARKLGKDTSNFHKQLHHNFMDIHLLWDIADTLNYDIFATLSVKFQERETPKIYGENIPQQTVKPTTQKFQ